MLDLLVIKRIFLVILFYFAIALNSNFALADEIKSDAQDNLTQAAQEVVKDTGVKQQFGQSNNGDKLLEQAQNKANSKLNKLAAEANSNDELPPSKKLFLDNLQGKNSSK